MSNYDVKYGGKFYGSEAPDTFDITERAAAGISGVAGCIDQNMDYLMWFTIHYTTKKPYMQHSGADIPNAWKLLDDLTMLRQICGSDEYLELEQLYREHSLKYIKDGLMWNYYDKDNPQPWRVIYNEDVPGKVRHDEDFAYSAIGPRVMQTMQSWQQIDNNPVWERYAEEMMDGFLRIALTNEDYLYLPADGGYGHPFTYPASGWLSTRVPEDEHEGSEGSIMDQLGFPLLAAAMYHRYTDSPKALDIARRMYNFCKIPKYWGGTADLNGAAPGTIKHIANRVPDPACLAGGEMGHWHSHYHAHARTLRGILEYGITDANINAIEFAKRGYDFSWSMGIPRIGWINCCPVTGNVMEGCAMGDTIALAIKLSDTGVGDYWDDADAIVRNILAEAQYMRDDAMQTMVDGLKRPEAEPITSPFEIDYPGYRCYDNILKRSKGVIFGSSLPDCARDPWVMHCCTGNGLQGFYYAWEGAVRENGDSSQVNLLFNRASKGLDVNSWLPYQGKVVIKNKSMKNIAVRIPGWTDKRQVKQFVNNFPTSFIKVGNYIHFTGLSPNDEIRLEFPVPTVTHQYTASAQTKDEKTYTVTTRGSTVVDISPRLMGEGIYPYFVRDHMKTATDVKMKTINRYVPDKVITKW